jgi:hypothetical protein
VTDGVGPSEMATRIWSVAPAPVGAPFAMSTVGNEPSRAPATPSFVRSPETGSGRPVWVKCVTTWALSKCLPPSNERDMKIASAFACASVPSQKT